MKTEAKDKVVKSPADEIKTAHLYFTDCPPPWTSLCGLEKKNALTRRGAKEYEKCPICSELHNT